MTDMYAIAHAAIPNIFYLSVIDTIKSSLLHDKSI